MAHSRTERLWIVGGSLAAALLALLGWLVVISPKLSSASSLRSQKGEIQTQNDLLQSKVNKLRAADANMAQLTAELSAAQAALPPDSGLSAFSDQLRSQAAATRVSITSITAGAPGLATPGKAVQAAKPSATAVAGGLYSIPITLSVTGSPAQELAFLKAVQHGSRAALVTSAQLATQGSGTATTAQTTLTLQLQIFASPQAQGKATPTQPSAG